MKYEIHTFSQRIPVWTEVTVALAEIEVLQGECYLTERGWCVASFTTDSEGLAAYIRLQLPEGYSIYECK